MKASSTRTDQKRSAILEAATALFLEQGYDGTSMDQIAARAAVSKQTVYKQFTDKERLFETIVLRVTETAAAFADGIGPRLRGTDDVGRDLHDLARAYVRTVMQPQVIQLRRLLIGQAARFPQLGLTYYEQGPERVIGALADAFAELSARNLLHVADPRLAAQHYAFLVLSIPLDRALICDLDEKLQPRELDRLADAGVDVFLAAYGAHQ